MKTKIFTLIALLSVSLMGWAEPRLVSEYCQEPMGAIANGRIAGFTWETNASGDVVITLSEADGGAAGSTNFRNTNKTGNGMCNEGLGKFKVGGVDATNYFERDFTLGSQVYTLKLKDGVAAPALGTTITFSGYVEYETSENKDCWPNLSFSYTYGSKCAALDKPTSVVVNASKVITFDAVTGATSYKAFVYWGDELFYEQVVTNGGILDYHPSLTGTYHVYVQAYGSDDAFSPVSDAIDWELTAELAYLPQSEWCDRTYETHGANESEDVNFTWTTDAQGNVIITLSKVDGASQTVPATDFRGTYGMSINKFSIGDEEVSTYFERETSGAVLTLSLKDPAVKPAYGTLITFDGTVQYRTGTHSNCWPTLQFSYVYGTTCNGYNDHVNPIISEFNVVSKTVSSITFHVAATDADDLGTSRAIASYEISSSDNDFATTSVTPDSDGNFTISSDLVSNGVYTFTIRVIDAIGNYSTEDVEVTLPLDPDFNLAKGKTAVAGKTQGDYTANLGCDGNEGTMWSSFTSPQPEKDYWYVDLGAIYKIRQVSIKWMNDNATRFLIQGVNTLPEEEVRENDDAWTTYLDHTYAEDPLQVKQDHAVVGKMRYLRLKALGYTNTAGINFYELEVYGSDYAEDDNVAPVITTQGCTTDTETSTATLTLVASDAVDGAIKDFYISCADPVMAETKFTTDGDDQIAISGLENDKDYSFTIRCRDLSGNWTSTTVVAHFAMALGTNVAEHKTATAGSVEGNNTADKAVDGDNDTKWGNYTGSDLVGNINWWKVDLHNAYKLTQIAIKWEWYPEAGGIIIEGSVNDIDFTEIVSYSGERIAGGTRQVLDVPAAQLDEPYRFIRIKAENQAKFMSFYEFEVYASEEIPFATFGDAATDNSAVIAALNNAVVDVVLNRTILTNDGWYTLCLPFDMSAAKVTEVFGSSTIAEMTGAEDRGSLIHLNFDYVNAIEAGKAYLFKPGTTFTAGTIIEGVTINNVTPIVSGDELMHFQGTYDATMLTADNIRFVADDDYLYSPAEGGTTMGAFRCYFTIPDGSPASAPGRRAKIFFGEETPTEVENIQIAEDSVRKILRDGIFLIIRDGRTYNAQGILIK